MIWNLRELLKHSNEVHAKINGRYVPARPVAGPFICKVKAAWEVFRGRADAFTWPEGQ